MLYKEYNLNLIDLNKLLSDKIELNISNFIYDNNLTLSLSSRDFNYIDDIIYVIKKNYTFTILSLNMLKVVTGATDGIWKAFAVTVKNSKDKKNIHF